MMDPKLSLFLPVYNEEENLRLLNERMFQTMGRLGHSFEVIYVDDGGADRSLESLKEFAARDRRARVISFRRNYGQTAATAAFLMGLIAEMVARAYHESQGKPIYTIKTKINFEGEVGQENVRYSRIHQY